MLEKCQKRPHTYDTSGPLKMETISKQLVQHASALPEGTPLSAKALLHFGNRAAVDQALSRLVQRGLLLRAGRGIYVRPVKSRFGTRAPSAVTVAQGLATERGEITALHGAAAANILGLTTQVPMRTVYLTSGPSRSLKLGAQTVEFRHAPSWQLILPSRAAGDVVRALAWIGAEKAGEAFVRLREILPPSVQQELVSVRARVPTWLARELGTLVPNA